MITFNGSSSTRVMEEMNRCPLKRVEQVRRRMDRPITAIPIENKTNPLDTSVVPIVITHRTTEGMFGNVFAFIPSSHLCLRFSKETSSEKTSSC